MDSKMPPACDRCGSPRTRWVRDRWANGLEVVKRQCEDCDRILVKAYPYKEHSGWKTYPLARDGVDGTQPCEVCGAPASEEHHWAPFELFGVAALLWPTGNLCPQHHRFWHRRISEPCDPRRVQESTVAFEHPDGGCEVCGTLFTVEHSWAPAAYFGIGAAFTWPASRLCVRHQRAWHRGLLALQPAGAVPVEVNVAFVPPSPEELLDEELSLGDGPDDFEIDEDPRDFEDWRD